MHACTYASTNTKCEHGYNALLNGMFSKIFEEKIRMVKKRRDKGEKEINSQTNM